VRRVALLTSVSILAMIGAGCRHDGRTLRPAGPDQNQSISTTSIATSTTIGSSDEVVGSTGDSSGASVTSGG
jgi:hypothetical protein